MEILGRGFYLRDTLEVAMELLGKYIVVKHDSLEIITRIVETEAYIGPWDKAAHSYNYRRTDRNEIMYHVGGFSYIYMIYGMYNCLNAVTEDEEKPTAVLIRAVEPVSELNALSINRYNASYSDLSKAQKKNLTNGPGKLCKALKLDRTYNGIDLCKKNESLYICKGMEEKFEICSSPRIGIDYAEEYIHKPWRFYIKDNSHVSKLKGSR